MKVNKQEYEKNKKLFEKVLNCTFSSTTNSLMAFLPIGFEDDVEVDELGMKKTKYKAETFYGNSLILGYTSYFGEIAPAYIRSTNAFTFDVDKLGALTDLELTKEEMEIVTKYEWCLGEVEHLFVFDADISSSEDVLLEE